VAEWVFPNAIAESVRRTATLKGEHANRIELRDPDDRWPPFRRVSADDSCEGASNLRRHETSVIRKGEREFTDPFCRTCGELVAS
jgi:hypothetical protein